MILTCPACGTQYVVKDGAIPPGGRQVRCASCRHSWHQDPETSADEPGTLEQAPPDGEEIDETLADRDDIASDTTLHSGDAQPVEDAEPEPAPAPPAPPVAGPPPPEADVVGLVEGGPETDGRWDGSPDDFSPFAEREPVGRGGRRGIITFAVLLLLIAAVAAAFWMLAPAQWRAQLGLAGAEETPLQLMMTHSDRQQLASGNELLAVSGRVINPTDESQSVPPIRAQLRSSTGELVYSWTIPPPARTLPPGGSASFNSAELNVPAGGEELTISLGQPKA